MDYLTKQLDTLPKPKGGWSTGDKDCPKS